MAKWKQYELWVQTASEKWEMLGVFPNPEVPTALARTRNNRSRLIEVSYDGSKLLGQEVVAELGMPGAEKLFLGFRPSAGTVPRRVYGRFFLSPVDRRSAKRGLQPSGGACATHGRETRNGAGRAAAQRA